MLLTVGILLGFFLAFLGDKFISYLSAVSMVIILFVAFQDNAQNVLAVVPCILMVNCREN